MDKLKLCPKRDIKESEAVVSWLRSISSASVQEVLGPYDAVVELEKATTADIAVVVRSMIQRIPGVNSTATRIWVDGLLGKGGGE